MEWKNKRNDCLGWVLKRNPRFWQDNGFVVDISSGYYGCTIAEGNHRPIYKKQRYINHDYEQEASVEVFCCGLGSVAHEYMVYLNEWNNAGYSGYSLQAAKQVQTIHGYNEFIREYGYAELEDGETFLIEDK